MAALVAVAVAAAAINGDGNFPGAGVAGGPLISPDASHSRTPHPPAQLVKPHRTSISKDITPVPHNHTANASSYSSSYAFITHSQEGLRENRPPMIDNAGLARRRRRRTSQHDQAILEEEYRKCDRPDKARRREIAAMVEMGDKEVQIWFQNKRQSARRKLKPLLPHEIIPNSHNMKSSSSPAPTQHHHHHHHYHNRAGYNDVWKSGDKREEKENNVERLTMKGWSSETEVMSKSPGARGGRSSSRNSQERKEVDQGSSQEDEFPSSQSSSQNHGYYSRQQTPLREKGNDRRDNHDGDEPKLPPAAVRRMSMSHMRLQEALSSPVCPPAVTTRVPPLTATQRRHSFARDPPSELSEYIHSDFPQQQTPVKSLPTPSLALPTPQPNPRRTNPQGGYQPPTLQKRSSSFLRLSTSLDGHAEVVIDTEPTLPPPLPHSRSGNVTPRRGAPLPSTSSVLRDIDSMRSSRVWEYCCDKQQQPFHSSETGGLSQSHPHHPSALEPDEAGMALSIARSRRRREMFKEARRKLVFDDVERDRDLMRDDSGLGGMTEGLERQASYYEDEDGLFSNSRKPVRNVGSVSSTGRKRGGDDLVSTQAPVHHPSTHPAKSISARKRTYHEIEIYEQPQSYQPYISSSQTTAPSSSDVRKKLFSGSHSPHNGEDIYIFGNESDKENYGEGENDGMMYSEKNVFGEVVNGGGKQRPLKAVKRIVEKEKDRRRGPEGITPAMTKSKMKTASGRIEERRPRKKRRVLGEVEGEQGPVIQTPSQQQQQPQTVEEVKGKGAEAERPQSQGKAASDVDLGGAELLLSLSAGRWGC